MTRRLLVSCAVLLSVGQAAHAQPADDDRAQLQRERVYRERLLASALVAVVVVDGQLAGAPSQGAGIAVGRRRDELFVVTANHVVRRGPQEAGNLRVTLRRSRATPRQARLLPQFDTALDVAVLSVAGVPRADLDVCSELTLLPSQGDDRVKRGAAVLPVGHPNGVLWAVPAIPDAVSQVDPDRIVFQSTVLSPGHSGGGLFTPSGSLLGLIVQDTPPFGRASPIAHVVQALQRWSVPVQLGPGHRELPIDYSPAFPVSPPVTSFVNAVKAGDLATVERSLEICDPDVEWNGSRPLGLAVEHRRLDVARALLRAGAKIDRPYPGNGFTPLHYAAMKGGVASVRLLLDAGANAKSVGRNGMTPLHLAAYSGDAQAAQALIDAGADVNARTRDGKTPLAVGEERKHEEVAHLIRAHGGRAP